MNPRPILATFPIYTVHSMTNYTYNSISNRPQTKNGHSP